MDFLYHIHIMTLFPDVVGDMLCESILGRAQERGIIRVDCHQIRDYTLNKQKQVDNYPYGGGHGAVMQADPLYQCWNHICQENGFTPSTSPLPARCFNRRMPSAFSGITKA